MSNVKEDDYKNAYIYINEQYYDNPKELWKFIGKLIEQKMAKNSSQDLLDVGCARGEFIYYLKNTLNFNKIVGFDYSQTLLEMAKNYEGKT